MAPTTVAISPASPNEFRHRSSDILDIVRQAAGQPETCPYAEFWSGNMFVRLLSRWDKEYFLDCYSTTEPTPPRASRFKKIYLRLLEFARERLGEDWCEMTMINFVAITQGDLAALEAFAILVLAAVSREASLRLEIDCNLALLVLERRDSIRASLERAIPTTAKRETLKSIDELSICLVMNLTTDSAVPPHSNIQYSKTTNDPTTATDYKSEFEALECLFEAISGEADALRHQLMSISEENGQLKARMEGAENSQRVLGDQVDMLRAEQEALVLEKAQLIAEMGKVSELVSSFLSTISVYDQSVLGPSDAQAFLSRLVKRCDEQATLIGALQSRCEEAEMARDVLIEKERMLLDDRAEAERCLTNELQDEQGKTTSLQEHLGATQGELSQHIRDKEQLSLRIAQMEDEILSIASERSALATREKQWNLQSQRTNALMQQMQGLEGELERSKTLYQRLCHRHALTCHFYYADIQELEETLSRRERHISKLKNKLATRRLQCNSLRDTNQQVQSHRSKLKKKLKKLWARFHNAQRSFEQTRKGLEEEAAERELFLEQSQEEIGILREQLVATSGNVRVLEDKVKEFSFQLQKTQSSLNLAQIELEDRASGAEGYLVRLEGELLATVTELQDTRDNSMLLRRQCEELAEGISVRDTTIRELETLLGAARQGARARHTKIQELGTSVASIIDRNTTFARDLALIKQELDTSAAAHSGHMLNLRKEWTCQVKTLQSQLVEAECKVAEQERKIASMSAERESLSKEAFHGSEMRREMLEAIRNQHREEINIMSENLEKIAERQSGEWEHERKRLLIENERLEECLWKQRELVGKLKDELEELSGLRQQLVETLELAQERTREVETLKEEIEKVTTCRDKERDLNDLIYQETLREKERLEGQIEQLAALCSNYQATESGLKGGVERLQQQLDSIQTERDGLAMAIGCFERKESEWMVERMELASWLEEQQRDLEGLHEKYHNQQSKEVETGAPVLNNLETDTSDLERMQTERVASSIERDVERKGQEIRAMRATLLEEHRDVLSIWHDMGQRLYRNKLYRAMK